MAYLTILIVFVAVTLLLTAGSFVAARSMVRRAAAIDRELRPQEAMTGRCSACDSAGTRIEPWPGMAGSHDEMVTCYRCGGDGLPLPEGEIARLPGSSPAGHLLRQISHAGGLWRTRLGHRRRPL